MAARAWKVRSILTQVLGRLPIFQCASSAGRAIGLTTASFVVGIMIGSLANAWLNVDIVPLGVSCSAEEVEIYILSELPDGDAF